MRKAILSLGIAMLLCFSFDAQACARCGTDAYGCNHCYEAVGDGGLDCYLLQGEWCTIVGPGQCEGVGDSCEDDRCPRDKWVSRTVEPEREWQLVSVQVIRPAARS